MNLKWTIFSLVLWVVMFPIIILTMGNLNLIPMAHKRKVWGSLGAGYWMEGPGPFHEAGYGKECAECSK